MTSDKRKPGASIAAPPPRESRLDGCVVRVGRWLVIVIVIVLIVWVMWPRPKPVPVHLTCVSFPLPPGAVAEDCAELEPGADAWNLVARTNWSAEAVADWYRNGAGGLTLRDAPLQVRGVAMLQDDLPEIDIAVSVVATSSGTRLAAAWQNDPASHPRDPAREAKLSEILDAIGQPSNKSP